MVRKRLARQRRNREYRHKMWRYFLFTSVAAEEDIRKWEDSLL